MEKIIRNPIVGTALAVAAGFSFYVLCMMLPLVGPAGSKMAHAVENRAAFILVLLLTFLLASGSTALVLVRRKLEEAVAFPLFACGLAVLCLIMLVLLMAGWFTV
ncbi:MAG: hypothetical protein JXR40_14320 [Pontiellaceae bacterium]|nr:hypothetical protein [Pontiellaceae bacterium]